MSTPPPHNGPTTQGTAAYEVYRLGRKLSRLPVLKAMIPARLRVGVQRRLLMRAIDRLPDRRYMEEVILPAVAGLNPKRILDVGVDDYTKHYGRWFTPDTEYWTLDINPGVARYGAPGRHIVGSALDLASYFEPGSVDVILMNGPFGFGVDRVDEQERTIAAAREIIRPGGRLMIGWDRTPDGRPFVMQDHGLGESRIKDPLELEGIRAHFEHTAPAGLPARIDFAECPHIYDWFQSR